MYIKGSQIYDNEGRTLILRGCNLGGSTKVPVISAQDKISYTGKPFPLEDAEERFSEMKKWGLRFNRLVVPWDALEHDGPGIYDEEYLAYLRKLLLTAEKYGISIWIDPHQDVWGRSAGGDGAPAWTLQALGIDVSKLEAAGAVLPQREIDPPDKRVSMIWPAGYSRYAAASMFTLFFAGNVYAPSVKPDAKISGGTDESIQDWLQNRYISAYAHCKRRLKNCAAIAGWGTMNEPHPGFTGYKDLNNLENYLMALGPMPSAFSSMAAASGYKMEVPVYSTGISGVKKKGKMFINPDGVCVFKEGFICPWKASGVWRDGTNGPVLLKPDHFANAHGRPVNFYNHFLSPFMANYIKRLSENDEKSFFFTEGIPGNFAIKNPPPSENAASSEGSGRVINGFHWYDGPTMFLKQWRSWFNFDLVTNKIVLGRKAIASLFKNRIKDQFIPGMPNILGEFGIPFDLFKGRAYVTGNYSKHEEALSMYYDALDELHIGCCIWCYSADNTFRRGDSWNNEDFSIVTTGKGNEDGNSSLKPRAVGGWMRPYPLAVAGIPQVFKWDRKNKKLFFRYKSSGAINAPTMIFIPDSILEKPLSANPFNLSQEKHSVRTEYKPEENLFLVYHDGFDGEIVVR